MPAERKAGFCALCRSRCGAWYVVEDGRLAGVEPWPGHPTGGALCPKGRAAPELIEHPRRLRKPLRRTRPKTDADPGWVEVSWDEALDIVAARLLAIRAESGAEAVAFSAASPSASAISDSLEWIERLIFAFGSPNFVTGVEICNWHRDHGHAFTFGHGIGMPDFARTDLALLWGFNPSNTWLAQAGALAAARARGARLLVVDPAPTRHAQSADLWLRVRPGTDAALALGIAHRLIETGRFDDDFVRRWSNGPFLVRDDTGLALTERDLDAAAATERPLAWDAAAGAAVAIDTARELAPDAARRLALRGSFGVGTQRGALACRTAFELYAAACAAWTPERVERFCGVPAAQVEAAAALIAGSPRVSYFCWTGISQHVNASQADRAIALLHALTGCIDVPGGNLQPARQPAATVNDRAALLPAGQAERALGLAQRPLGPPAHGWVLGRDMHDAVLSGRPYRVRALVGFGANLLMSQADTAKAQAALERLEFQVHCDLFETPTARTADLLLPVNTPWQREGLRIGFQSSADAEALIQLRPAMVGPAPGDASRSDLAIVFELACRLGLGAQFFGGDVEAGWNHLLAPLGLSVEALRRQPEGVRRPLQETTRGHARALPDGGVRGFATPSRRVEFHSSRLARHGHAPVPEAVDPVDAVVLDAAEARRFPLRLGAAKSGLYCQSQHRALPSLRAREPEPLARLHPALGAARGIADGDWLRVTTRNGGARFRARFDGALDRDVVLASFGWWQGCEELGLAAGDPLADDGSHFNRLVDSERIDALSGSTPLRAFPCEIAPLPGRGRSWSGWKRFEARATASGDVLVLEVRPADGAPLPGFHAGQHVPLAFDAPGRGRIERSYSLLDAESAGVAGCWHVAVKRGEAPGLSQALHRAAAQAPRFAVELQVPRGHFLLPSDERRMPVVLVAAGIGITPFVSLLETWAAQAGAGRAAAPALLLHGSRDGAQHAFAGRVAALAARLPHLQVVDAYSRPRDADLRAQRFQHRGRVGVHLVSDDWIARGARFYLCGPGSLLADCRAGLLARGVPRHAIFSERFGTPAAAGDAATGPFDVHLARNGRTLRWTPADGSLLALAESNGVALPSGCRVGQCESCLLTLRDGSVRHLAEVDLVDEGTCLGCLAVPCSDLVLDA